jgi:hypothetical protein
MKKEAKIRICDVCDKRVQQEEAQCGGSPFSGWFELNMTYFHLLANDYTDQWPKDFCSLKCLKKFIKTLEKENE